MTFQCVRVCIRASLCVCLCCCLLCIWGLSWNSHASNDILLSHSCHRRSGFPLVCTSRSAQCNHWPCPHIPPKLPTHTYIHTPSGSLCWRQPQASHTASCSPTLVLPSVSIVLSWISREQPVARVIATLCSIQRARFGSSLAEDRQSKAHTLDFQAPL